MRNKLLSAVFLAAVTFGCAAAPNWVKDGGAGGRSDVFTELADEGAVPPGFAGLRIASSVKTHLPGAYASESDSHGTPKYRLSLNIDGQVIHLEGTLQEERREPVRASDPEAGSGMRYRFAKSLRLKPGVHRLAASMPEDGVVVERVITLAEGEVTTLILEPVYRLKPGTRLPGSFGATGFQEGIRSLKVTVNGREI